MSKARRAITISLLEDEYQELQDLLARKNLDDTGFGYIDIFRMGITTLKELFK